MFKILRYSMLFALLAMAPMIQSKAQVDPSFKHIDFGGERGANDWFVVLDGVMGGMSSGELSVIADSIVLEGRISLENNGGFASVRNPYADYDLSPYTKVEIRYRSDGQDFAMTLNPHRRFFRPRFKAPVPKTEGEWKTLTIALKDFGRYRLSDPIEGGPPTQDELARIIRFGLISNEKRASDYRIEVDYITFL